LQWRQPFQPVYRCLRAASTAHYATRRGPADRQQTCYTLVQPTPPLVALRSTGGRCRMGPLPGRSSWALSAVGAVHAASAVYRQFRCSMRTIGSRC
jgi:hypothetical protein